MEEVDRISPGEVKRMIEQNVDFVLLDVRSSHSYEASPFKIKGAKRIHPREVLDRADELPRDKLIVTY